MQKLNTQIYAEASEWFVLHRTGGLDLESKRRFDVWLRESPQHVRAYLEMSAIWEDVPALDPTGNARADELVARARADANVLAFESPPVQDAGGIEERRLTATELPVHLPTALPREAHGEEGHARSTRGRYLALAASLLVTLGVAGSIYLQRDTYATEVGEQRTIALADGSSIELNARSRIRIRYSEHERAIDLLQGQAFFRVAKDFGRPFLVKSNGAHVRAIGTQFDVYKKSSGTIVTVVEGRVAVLASTLVRADLERFNAASSETRQTPYRASGGEHTERPPFGAVYLGAGEQLLVASKAPAVPKQTNVEAAIAWTHQRLVFEFSPLTEVAEEFNRYNRRRLVIEDASLREFHVSGSFSSTDPTLLLRFLREQPEIVVHETASEIRISRQDRQETRDAGSI